MKSFNDKMTDMMSASGPQPSNLIIEWWLGESSPVRMAWTAGARSCRIKWTKWQWPTAATASGGDDTLVHTRGAVIGACRATPRGSHARLNWAL
eukprot:scaffold2021_cov25-Prasinocladus_malaysianus.AAC.1